MRPNARYLMIPNIWTCNSYIRMCVYLVIVWSNNFVLGCHVIPLGSWYDIVSNWIVCEDSISHNPNIKYYVRSVSCHCMNADWGHTTMAVDRCKCNMENHLSYALGKTNLIYQQCREPNLSRSKMSAKAAAKSNHSHRCLSFSPPNII